jgi:hypothetical protein
LAPKAIAPPLPVVLEELPPAPEGTESLLLDAPDSEEESEPEQAKEPASSAKVPAAKKIRKCAIDFTLDRH